MVPKDVRVYLIDKPNFLSCGTAYITNITNLIIINDQNGQPKYRTPTAPPYSLAPFPIPKRYRAGLHLLKNGTAVYPSDCMADLPSVGQKEEPDCSVILDHIVMTNKELQGYLESYMHELEEYKKKLPPLLKNDDELRRISSEISAYKISKAKREAILKRQIPCPSLVDIIRSKA